MVTDTYPHQLVGGAARPPVAVRAAVLEMARDARRREMAALAPPEVYGFTMPDWRLAHSLSTLRDEANEANPLRDKSSDGTIGNSAHAGRGPGSPEWDDSDHNPWLTVAGLGVVRAEDLDVDGLDLPAAVERARQLALAGKLPQLVGGGYIILNGRITAYDFTEWRVYRGTNAHVLHAHFSVSTDPVRFDDRRRWNIFHPAAVKPTPRPTPPPAPPSGWTGPDLRGSGLDLRGEVGANGPRVEALQGFLARYAPLYARGLDVDGWWGPQTSGVIREFGRRTGIVRADGLNIGPQLARKLLLAGFRG